MKKLPDAIFVVDPRKEHIAIAEAHKLGIPVVGTVDTNCDPDEIDYAIPANDDAIRAVKLLTAKIADAILEEVERRVLPGLRASLVTRFHYTPADFGRDLSAHLGSAFSLEPVLWQSAWFRAHNRDDVIDNLYFVGAGTHPGAGIPGVVGSAKATAALMLEVPN